MKLECYSMEYADLHQKTPPKALLTLLADLLVEHTHILEKVGPLMDM
jgi:hypothetical protein